MKEPRSLAIAKKGKQTPADVKNALVALISGTITGEIAPSATNRICKEVGDRLKRLETVMRVKKKAKR